MAARVTRIWMAMIMMWVECRPAPGGVARDGGPGVKLAGVRELGEKVGFRLGSFREMFGGVSCESRQVRAVLMQSSRDQGADISVFLRR